ncbi:polycystin-1-like protein 1 [Nerophis ophidion]|uniref:polycystin-1-like protein 1 n=1 Tax=Nerophis ophidion TaxID=159077 RepID=UPI002ADFC54E|nr:polycystin-1-like protein 1 [Nerophis ophidion]
MVNGQGLQKQLNGTQSGSWGVPGACWTQSSASMLTLTLQHAVFSAWMKGIVGVSEHSLPYVTEEFYCVTPGGQSSQQVNVSDDGSFAASFQWILDQHKDSNEKENADSGLIYAPPFCRPASKAACRLAMWVILSHCGRVSIDAAGQAHPTNTDVTFEAVGDMREPVELLWNFGDSTSVRTTTKNVTKRYNNPGRYNITVVMSDGRSSLTSRVFPLFVQKPVKLNKLVHQASVLQNHTTTVTCRVNTGTDVTFLWRFGDGTTRTGQSTEQHVFLRTGEFQLEVTVSNRVSSASLRGIIFVVEKPCQPPPVKNMGPHKLQVRRHESIHLGVTYEDEMDCDVSKGLRYTWTLLDSAGHILPVTDAHHQRLILPGHLLHYDTYTAIAKVQVVGSVVYSNYSVRVEVMPSSPVAAVHGGTNIFINNSNVTMVTLDGRKSYNPDFPMNQISFKWMCEPVSSIKSSCFDHHVVTSSAVLNFPVSFLKYNFDQYRFTLTVYSGEQSASSDTFVTLMPNVIGRVTVSCLQCEGDQVNWDESFTIKALCEDCEVPSHQIQYFWTLYLINASSKPVEEVLFCSTVDLSAPSTMKESTSSPPRPPRKTKSMVHIAGEELSLSESSYSSEHLQFVLNDGSIHFDLERKPPIDYDSFADWEFPAVETLGQDYNEPFQMAEGDPATSAGRPTGVGGQTLSPGDDFNPGSHDTEGSNLVESSSSRRANREMTLLDLPRGPVEAGLFESYTDTGISSPLLNFKPFSLRAGTRYMLEVFAKSQGSVLGRTQLFLRTKPVPKGMTCQVQPSKGMELYTHFSIFCTSGREDLLYEHSFTIGKNPPRMLYQGRNFQYYFSLPSGNNVDDYKVTIYTKIRSSTYGSSTRVCPVTVQVLPSFFRDVSFHNPDVELCQSGLKNLSALVLCGNSAEIRNYISLLSSILNRLSLDSQADEHWQRHVRSVLISTMCELEGSEKDSMTDTVCILKDLLQVTRQVTLACVRLVAAHVGVVCEQLYNPDAQKRYPLDARMVDTLVTVLAYSLEAAVTSDVTHKLESDIQADYSSDDILTKYRTVEQLVDNILQTASDLILKHMFFNNIQEYRIHVGLMSLYVTHQNSSVINSGSAVFYTPAALLQSLRGECVLYLITELTHSPWTLDHHPDRISGPIVDLTLYKCSMRRKISLRSLVHPIITELKTRQHKVSSRHYILLRSHINYHSFNITHEHLQRAIQLSVVFMLPPNMTFPIMLLFRMFAKPTPSMHHLQKIHLWETNTTHITLSPSYLNSPGIGYLALLNADFGKPVRHKHLSSHVSYNLAVDTIQCLSLDRQKGAWTSLGCSTHQADRKVNCSCHQLRALTVLQQQIQSSHDTAHLDPFIRESINVTVLVVLALCVCLYIPAFVQCRKADAISELNHRVHYLRDNCPQDTHFYAVTIHTGLCSTHRLSAKVYIALHGEDGVSQTRELQVPGFFLFRRNSHDTFILSAADSLGPVWGVHIWHDNTGPSPHLYLTLVQVSEVSQADVKGHTWLFVSQCWLSVSKGDGQVERMLDVCTQSIGLTQMLGLTLCDYMADFHMWMSVFSCPWPQSFMHTQRLSVCLLLFMSYACVNALKLSQMDDTHAVNAVSAVPVTTGVFGTVVALPIATLITFLFREGKLFIEEECARPGKRHCEVDDSAAFKNHQGAENNEDKHNVEKEGISRENQAAFRSLCVCDKLSGRRVWCYYVAWTLCLLLSLVFLLFTAVLGLRFSGSKVQLWIHSLFFSLLSCIFLIQPIVIFAFAGIASLWNRRSANFFIRTTITTFDRLKAKQQKMSASNLTKFDFQLLEERQRARFLRLVRPPTAAELRRARGQSRREALVHKTIRDLCVLVAMLLLMMCISSGRSFSDYYRFNKAVRQCFTGGGFMSIRTNEDWWEWTQSSVLNLIYGNAAKKFDVIPQSHMLIGEPIVWLKEISSVGTSPSLCCSAAAGLGHTKYDATDRLKALQSNGCVALQLRFTFYSPAPDLFTTVTLLAENNPMRSSAEVHSVKVNNTPSIWDYVSALCQLLFLTLSLLNLCFQVCTAWQQGIKGYCMAACNWLDITLQIMIFVYYYHIYRSAVVMEVAELVQNCKAHVDVRLLAAAEQNIRSLLGVIVFLLLIKCSTMLRVNKKSAAISACTLPHFFLPMMSCLILRVVACYLPIGDHKGIDGPFHLGSFLNCRALCLFFSAVMMAISSGCKRCQCRKETCTVAELHSYIRRRVCKREATSALESKTYYLEECERLVDELLFKLNNLQCTLPPPVKACQSVISGALKRQSSQSTSTGHIKKGGTTTQYTHGELLVEVLIHQEPS